MFNRVLFVLIAGFWLTMNLLLWRSEFSQMNHPGSLVPAAMVWQKILTAPDDFEPEGMVRQLTGYTIDLEGTLLFEELENRLRFSLHAIFSANHNWQEF